MASSSGPVDVSALAAAALALLPPQRRDGNAGVSMLEAAFAAGPSRQALRPSELEQPALAEALHQEAMFGASRIFDRTRGVDTAVEGHALVLSQDRGATLRLEQSGALLIRLPLERPGAARSSFAVIEEDVARELALAMAFAVSTLERIDEPRRLSHVALAVRIDAGDFRTWRSRAEETASPNSGTMRGFGSQELPVAQIDCPRAALQFQAREITEDLVSLLRRQMRG